MLSRIVAVMVLSSFLLVNLPVAYGQNILTLGEIKISGKVLIAASNNQWLPAMQSYPLLLNTGIKTEDGTAALFLKDGSRIDINKNSIATISGSEPADYALTIAQGTVAFNMKAPAILTVTTPTATVNVNSAGPASVQKVSAEKTGRIIGAITVTDKGTEVRSVSGRILVSPAGGEVKVLAGGENAFVGTDNRAKIYTTQAVAQSDDDRKKAGALLPQSGTAGSTNYTPAYIIGGIMAGTITLISFDVWRGSGHNVASPSGF